jgi:hypothetical protein
LYASVREAWKHDYESNKPIEQPFKRQRRRSKSPDDIDIFLRNAIAADDPDASDSDEFDRYIHGVPINVDNLIQWWAGQSGTLAQQAIDTLSIPATSCEVERLFLTAGRLVT